MSDGLLLTRRERARAFGRHLALALAPSALLALLVLATSEAVVAAVAAVAGALLALSIATSVRTARGAVVAGGVVALLLLLGLLAIGWLASHPILPD